NDGRERILLRLELRHELLLMRDERLSAVSAGALLGGRTRDGKRDDGECQETTMHCGYLGHGAVIVRRITAPRCDRWGSDTSPARARCTHLSRRSDPAEVSRSSATPFLPSSAPPSRP